MNTTKTYRCPTPHGITAAEHVAGRPLRLRARKVPNASRHHRRGALRGDPRQLRVLAVPNASRHHRRGAPKVNAWQITEARGAQRLTASPPRSTREPSSVIPLRIVPNASRHHRRGARQQLRGGDKHAAVPNASRHHRRGAPARTGRSGRVGRVPNASRHHRRGAHSQDIGAETTNDSGCPTPHGITAAEHRT